MRLDKAGLDLIKRFEGWSSTVYPDAAGFATIGYGHLIKQGESFSTLTLKQGEELLRKDADFAENAVNDLIDISINQNQFNALVSFTYNLGVSAFRNSTLRKRINQGRADEVKAEFEKWNKAGGRVLPRLVARRNNEAVLYFA